MTIELVKVEDCNRSRHRQKYLAIKIEEQIVQPNKPISIPLVKIEECSSIKKRLAEKMTAHEKGTAIRLGDIDIPEGDKRYICEYYNKESRSCSLYPNRYCSRCKKNILSKTNRYGWAHAQE